MVAVVSLGLDAHRVIGAREVCQRKAGIELDGDLHREHQSFGTRHHGRRDALGIDHRLRRGRPARGTVGGRELRTGDVARRDRQRKAQAEGAFVVAQRFLVLEGDGDLVARADVGHARGEHVGTLLLHEARAASAVLCRLVGAPGLAALLDEALDVALADFHPQVVHRGLFRQRKHVHAFAPLVGGIDEPLRDRDARDHAGDAHRDVGEDERRLRARAVGGLEVERARRRARRGGEGGARDDVHGQRERYAHHDPRAQAFGARSGPACATGHAGPAGLRRDRAAAPKLPGRLRRLRYHPWTRPFPSNEVPAVPVSLPDPRTPAGDTSSMDAFRAHIRQAAGRNCAQGGEQMWQTRGSCAGARAG